MGSTGKPKRIQRKRTKGWKMPPNTVYVGRPSKWGNPFIGRGPEDAVRLFRRALTGELDLRFARIVVICKGEPKLSRIGEMRGSLDELRGKNLACWCPLDQPCHADVLLELANPPAASGLVGRSPRKGEKGDGG